MIFSVTGIRKMFTDNLPKEELDRKVEQYLSTLAVGTRLLLQLEPDNQLDRLAIGVYLPLSTKQLGYVQTDYFIAVYPLLDERGNGSATLAGWDGHVTLMAEVDGVLPMPGKAKPQLPPITIPQLLRIRTLEQESVIDRIMPSLMSAEPSSLTDNEFLAAARLCLPGLSLTICDEDKLWRALLEERLHRMAGQGNAEADELYTQLNATRRAITRGGQHSTWMQWLQLVAPLMPEGDYRLTKSDIDNFWLQLDVDPAHPEVGLLLYYRHLSRREVYVAAQLYLLWLKSEGKDLRQKPDFKSAIPPYLREGKLYSAWTGLRDAGFLDADFQLTNTSRMIAKYIVSKFCEKKDKIYWSKFEKFWGVQNLKTHKGNLGLETSKKIDAIFNKIYNTR